VDFAHARAVPVHVVGELRRRVGRQHHIGLVSDRGRACPRHRRDRGDDGDHAVGRHYATSSHIDRMVVESVLKVIVLGSAPYVPPVLNGVASGLPLLFMSYPVAGSPPATVGAALNHASRMIQPGPSVSLIARVLLPDVETLSSPKSVISVAVRLAKAEVPTPSRTWPSPVPIVRPTLTNVAVSGRYISDDRSWFAPIGTLASVSRRRPAPCVIALTRLPD